MRPAFYLVTVMALISMLFLAACGGGAPTTVQPVVSPPTTTQPAVTTPPPPTTTHTTPPTTTPVTATPSVTPPPAPTGTPEPGPTETTEPAPTPSPSETTPPLPFTLTSSAFAYGQPIPVKYGYFGSNKSPPLAWSDAPAGTRSFALIMEDPDGSYWSHWVIFNIPETVSSLAEGLPSTPTISGVGTQGINDFGGMGYGGPAPPYGLHHYYFKLYALDSTLDLAPGAGKQQLINAMNGHILGTAEYMGTFTA